MEKLTLNFIGKSAMLMHSDRGANPLDPDAQAHKALTSQRKKTDELYAAIAKSEWLLGLYHDKELGPCVPSMNLRSCIIEGGRLSKLGKAIERAILPLNEMEKLEYKGPRSKEELWVLPEFRDMRSVVVSGRVMRCRPKFSGWKVQFSFVYDADVISKTELIQSAEKAGAYIGLGDFRPVFGRFDVEAK